MDERAKKLFSNETIPETMEDVEMMVDPIESREAAAPGGGPQEVGEALAPGAPDLAPKVSDMREVPHDFSGMDYYLAKSEVLVRAPQWVGGNRGTGELLDLAPVDGNELSLTFRDSPPFKQAILHGYPLGPSANPEGTPMADLFKNQICSSEVSPSQSGVAGTQNSVSSSPFG